MCAYIYIYIYIYIVKLKGRTRRLLPPTSQLGFIVLRDHEWHAVIYVNSATIHGWIKIKQVVNPLNERWNVTTKLCELNSFHGNTKRKKQEMTSKMAYLEVQKWRKCILRIEYQKYSKNGSMSIIVSAIFRPRISSHMQISVSQETGIKEALWGGAFCWLLHYRIAQTSVLMLRVRERSRETELVVNFRQVRERDRETGPVASS